MQNRWLSVINCTDSSKQLLHNFDVPFPPKINRSTLFIQKISNIRSKFKQCTFQDCENCNPPENLNTETLSFNCFEPLTQNGVYNIIMGMAKKSCSLDPMPTPLGPVVRKPIKANPRLKINQGVYFSTPKCCSTLIFSTTLQ